MGLGTVTPLEEMRREGVKFFYSRNRHFIPWAIEGPEGKQAGTKVEVGARKPHPTGGIKRIEPHGSGGNGPNGGAT